MKTGYILIDLNSLCVLGEDEKQSLNVGINKYLLAMLHQLQADTLAENYQIKIVFIVNQKDIVTDLSVAEDKSEVVNFFFCKDTYVASRINYKTIVDEFNRMCAVHTITSFKLWNIDAPIMLKMNDNTQLSDGLARLSLLSGFSDIKLLNMLIVSSNNNFIETLSDLGVTALLTSQEGDLDLEHLENIRKFCKDHPEVNIHWFLDIDQTLFFWCKSIVLNRIELNLKLIEFIKEMSATSFSMRCSVLTARSNPFDKFEQQLTQLRTEAKKSKNFNNQITDFLDITDRYDIFTTLIKVQQLLTRLEGLFLSGDCAGVDLGILYGIQTRLDDLCSQTSGNALVYVESIVDEIYAQYQLKINIEDFSYVNIDAQDKAQVIEEVTRKAKADKDKANLAIFCEDNESQLIAASKVTLEHNNYKFMMLAAKHEGELEANYQTKLNVFLDKLAPPAVQTTVNSNHYIEELRVVGHWKPPQVQITTEEIIYAELDDVVVSNVTIEI